DAALESARAGTGSQTGPGLAARQAFLERRERERQAAAAAAQMQEQIVATRSAELTSKAADRAALDKLRDRKQEAHRRDAARVQDARLGEIGLTRRGLQAGGGS